MEKTDENHINIMEENIKMANLVEGIFVTGDYIDGLKDKKFTVTESPRYEDREDFRDETKTVRKLIVKVKISDGAIMDYMPNMTSIKTIVEKFGADMDKWIDKEFEWEVEEKRIGKETKKVLFVKE